MNREKLWTHNFLALIAANGFLFASFHFLLPTITLYAAGLGATGLQIGLIGGIFGYSAIFIRLFTDTGVRAFGKKNCLYVGLLLCILATLSYLMLANPTAIILARVIHGLGFGLSTTFAAAIAADVIPASRRGEGIGYFGLGSTVAMALAPALGLWLLSEGSAYLFLSSIAVSSLAIIMAWLCRTKAAVSELPPTPPLHSSIRNRLCERGTAGPSLLTILFGAGYGSVNTFIAMLAAEKNIEQAGLFFVVGTLFVFISRPFGGRLLDKHGAFAVVLPGAVSYLLALVIMVQATTLTGLLSASVLYGLGAGALLPALLTWMLNRVRPDRHSAASATFYNMLDIGTSTGLIALGTIAGNIGYTRMFYGVIGLMALFLILAIVQYYYRPQAEFNEIEDA
ncbi:MAG: MFS transporter [Selenomonas sp.]|uniref:MFS transporter n=1 Tax=Selenomonas sp. TaxID=2053611 RepID=UPI0025CFC4EF|nr:MFS transporter [Selenomonas sp.]MCR5757481.1 MFS transporter [Selenomonas sp.]